MENAILLDSTVAIHALGDAEPMRSKCRQFLARVNTGPGRAYASVEMVQEVVFHRMRRTGDRRASAQEGVYTAALATLLPFDREVLEIGLDLIARYSDVRGRDAVHVATALAYGIGRIASSDHGFDGIPGITRLDPLA
jgi:predicted nucleic acid-binding protein